jgi:hypothetical protein
MKKGVEISISKPLYFCDNFKKKNFPLRGYVERKAKLKLKGNISIYEVRRED